MKKNILHTIIALLLGALSLYIFFALIGVVNVWSAKNHLYAWIFNLPKTFQSTAFLLHNNIEGFIVAVPVLGVADIILGVMVNKKPVLFGLIAFVGTSPMATCFPPPVATKKSPTLKMSYVRDEKEKIIGYRGLEGH